MSSTPLFDRSAARFDAGSPLFDRLARRVEAAPFSPPEPAAAARRPEVPPALVREIDAIHTPAHRIAGSRVLSSAERSVVERLGDEMIDCVLAAGSGDASDANTRLLGAARERITQVVVDAIAAELDRIARTGVLVEG